MKEVALKSLNGRVYITRFFPVDPDDRIIMDSQSTILFRLDTVVLLELMLLMKH